MWEGRLGIRFKPGIAEVDVDAVTAADLVRNFAECREVAAQRSLFVTHHGRPTHVLLGIDRYRALMQGAEQEDGAAASDGAALIHMLADWLDDALILCDAAMTIRFVNRAVQALCRRPAQALLGRPLLDALPEVAGSLLEGHARRTVTGSEIGSADIPSPFQPEGWLHFRSFPLGSWNALMFRDISEDVRRYRLADVRAALLDAMRLHGEVAFMRLSVRGTIEQLNEPCTRLIGLSETRLRGVALPDIVARPDRVACRQALEAVLQEGKEQRLRAEIVSNEGDTLPVDLALTQLRGAYGLEGAVLVATRIAS